ncbi:MAG: TRL-like protein family [Candidatus Schekmanbacteria bacterium]|nr:TRL-like protein family [Candidatus Schekmanbacteria bacterium]
MKLSRGVLLAVVFSVLLISGCASHIPMGVIYTEVKTPMAAGAGDVAYTKVGTAKATSVLGIVATGDASTKAAVENGKITKIKYVDYSSRNILGIYGEYTVTVYGD